jgi:hypothetical protein
MHPVAWPIFRGSLTLVLLTFGTDDRAGVLTTFFTGGYGRSCRVPASGIGIVLQDVNLRGAVPLSHGTQDEEPVSRVQKDQGTYGRAVGRLCGTLMCDQQLGPWPLGGPNTTLGGSDVRYDDKPTRATAEGARASL